MWDRILDLHRPCYFHLGVLHVWGVPVYPTTYAQGSVRMTWTTECGAQVQGKALEGEKPFPKCCSTCIACTLYPEWAHRRVG